MQWNIVAETASQNSFGHNLFEKFLNQKPAWKPSFHGRFKIEFSCKGALPRNFHARSPFWESLQFFSDNMSSWEFQQLLSNNAPASKLLSKNTSIGKQFRWRIVLRDSAFKLLSKEPFPREDCIAERKTFSAKNICLVLAESFIFLPGRSFLTRRNSHRKTKQNKRYSHPKIRPCSFRSLLERNDEACWRPFQPACRSQAMQAGNQSDE